MWSRFYLSSTGRQVALMSGQIIALVLCLIYFQYLYKVNISLDKKAATFFQQTDCFIVSKKLNIKSRLIDGYRADFLISYNVNGVQYHHWISGNGLDVSFSLNQGAQEDILTRFDVGGTYPCWFNPEKPHIAFIVKRHNWLSALALIFPSLIGLITLFYFMKNVIELLRKSKRIKKLINDGISKKLH